MPRETALSASQNHTSPDYIGLVSFLLKPFLDNPQSLSVDCENVPSQRKIWLRVAFDSTDKGKVLGRGGRNIQAIGTILKTAAANVDQSIYLDIYGTQDSFSKESSNRRDEMGFRRERDLNDNLEEVRGGSSHHRRGSSDKNRGGKKPFRQRPNKPFPSSS